MWESWILLLLIKSRQCEEIGECGVGLPFFWGAGGSATFLVLSALHTFCCMKWRCCIGVRANCILPLLGAFA